MIQFFSSIFTMLAQNETEKRTKLLNYMGFFFEQCYNDVLGVGTVMNDILNYETSKDRFVNAVRSMVNKRKYPFGQIFGKLVHAIKMYMYLDIDTERLKYKQQGMNITMSRKEMKYFVKYLILLLELNLYHQSSSLQLILIELN